MMWDFGGYRQAKAAAGMGGLRFPKTILCFYIFRHYLISLDSLCLILVALLKSFLNGLGTQVTGSELNPLQTTVSSHYFTVWPSKFGHMLRNHRAII